MNAKEKEMVAILKKLKEEYGATDVKASMEAEGILLNEMLRTKEITMASGVGFSVKIGGCEALTDAKLAKDYGVSILMSPMIESKFALEKFLDMAASIYDKEEQKDTRFLINIETLDGYRKIDQILSAENLSLLDGIVIGRTDLSSAIKADDVDSPEMLDIAKEIFAAAKKKSVRCLIGGGISEKTIPFLEKLGDLVDGFETRKVVFGYGVKDAQIMNEAIRLALRFECLWYKWRQETYIRLSGEDAGRINKIEKVLAS